MTNFILTLTLLFFTSCSGQQTDTFSLTGKTRGIADGEVLLLRNTLTDKFIDSATVENNAFEFKTALSDFPLQTALFNEDGSGARILWIENHTMTFDARNSTFENAVVTGSATDSLAMIHRNDSRALKTYDEKVRQEIEFIERYPENILSAHNLSIMAGVFGMERSRELFLNLSKENKQSVYGKRIQEFLDLNIKENPQVGEKFRDFSMVGQKGLSGKLSDHEGKVILLEFWASWCLPCRRENPNLVETYNQFSDKGFEIFAVSLDEQQESWRKAIKEDGLEWIQVSDLKGRNNKAAQLYGVNAIPDNFLIDQTGKIVGRNLRGEKLDRVLSEILGGSGVTIKQDNNNTTVRISTNVVWQDETGKTISKAEAQKLLDTKDYDPHFDSVRNIMIVKRNNK